MSFGIAWGLADMQAMAAVLGGTSLPTTMRNEARKYLSGGLDQWATSPAGQFPGDTSICPDCHIVTCSYGTLPALIQLLRDIAGWFDAQGTWTAATQYLRGLADDLEGDASAPTGQNSSGREPWP